MFMLLHFVQRCVITRWIMMVLLLVSFSTQNTIWSVISQHVTTTQARFVARVVDRLYGIHVLLDTSGYGSERDFRLLAEKSDLVYYDLKLIDNQAHRRYTGVGNGPILHNLRVLSESGVPFVIRVPLVPGVTDTDQNLTAIGMTVKGLPGLVRVDLLPYNQAAGGKYRAAGMVFEPDYDESRPLNINTTIFEDLGVKVSVR